MAHRDFVRPSGKWPLECVPTPADWQRLDVAQSKTMNGDTGGSYAPVAPIIIGGLGLNLTSNLSLISGNVTTQTGGRIKLSANDFIALASSGSDSVVMPLVSAHLPLGVVSGASMLDGPRFNVTEPPLPAGVQTIIGSGFHFEIPKRYLHNAASLTKLVLHFRVVTLGQALPGTPVTVIPIAFNSDGSASQALNPGQISRWQSAHAYATGAYVTSLAAVTGVYFKVTAGGGGNSGGGEPAWDTTVGHTTVDNALTWTCMGRSGQLVAATPSANFAAGQAQTVTYDFDGTNTIDTTTYRYGVAILGANDASQTDPTQNVIVHALEIYFNSIADLRFE